jgi:hypothetical protein
MDFLRVIEDNPIIETGKRSFHYFKVPVSRLQFGWNEFEIHGSFLKSEGIPQVLTLEVHDALFWVE